MMITVLNSLNRALHTALETDNRVFILGEDILDPYGGAFKVTQGLSSAYPDRVLTTPVSEAGIFGVATGMALRGLRPVVEIMFGDFVTLVADQLINHAAKFRFMYNDQVSVPLVVRVPMGGRRGYGPTHSQSLEKLFIGIPGIRILAPCTFSDPGQLLLDAIFQDDDPVLYIENKIQYAKPLLNPGKQDDFTLNNIDIQHKLDYAPTTILRIRDAPEPIATFVTYGYMAELSLQAALQLAYQDEIFVELIVFTQIAPLQMQPIIDSVNRTNKLLVIEEGTYTLGWGAEVLARSVELLSGKILSASRVASSDNPIPASLTLESAVLPNVGDIVQAVKKMV
ncbi:MAG: alpha-ketoacid dehydrogenase subunit beta [Chloroflexota bacterium]|nr:MAG: alpha-ketoacid dehydrogenase subunit beta [Chloroflexota bacterium]